MPAVKFLIGCKIIESEIRTHVYYFQLPVFFKEGGDKFRTFAVGQAKKYCVRRIRYGVPVKRAERKFRNIAVFELSEK